MNETTEYVSQLVDTILGRRQAGEPLYAPVDGQKSQATIHHKNGPGTITTTSETLTILYDPEATARNGRPGIHVIHSTAGVIEAQEFIALGFKTEIFTASSIIGSFLKVTSTDSRNDRNGTSQGFLITSASDDLLVRSLNDLAFLAPGSDNSSDSLNLALPEGDDPSTATVALSHHLGTKMHLSRPLDGEKPMSHLLRVGKFTQESIFSGQYGSFIDAPPDNLLGTGAGAIIPAINGNNGNSSSSTREDALAGEFICDTNATSVSYSDVTLSLTNTGKFSTFATYAVEFDFSGIVAVNDVNTATDDVQVVLNIEVMALDMAGNVLDAKTFYMRDLTVQYGFVSLPNVTGLLRSSTSPVSRVVVYSPLHNIFTKARADANSTYTRAYTEMGFSTRKLIVNGVEETDDICSRAVHVHRIEGLSGTSSFGVTGGATMSGIVSPEYAAITTIQPKKLNLDGNEVSSYMSAIFGSVPKAFKGADFSAISDRMSATLAEMTTSQPDESTPIGAMSYDVEAMNFKRMGKKFGKFMKSKATKQAIKTGFDVAEMMGAPGASQARQVVKYGYRAAGERL